MRPESFKQWINRSVCIVFCLALTGLTPQLFADLEALEAEVRRTMSSDSVRCSSTSTRTLSCRLLSSKRRLAWQMKCKHWGTR